jgi:hypothetical protein
VLKKDAAGGDGEATDHPTVQIGELAQEQAHQQRDVLAPLAQRRQLDAMTLRR